VRNRIDIGTHVIMFATLVRGIKQPFILYNRLLETNPVATKSVTSGVMYAGGDVIAQVLEHYTEQLEHADSETGHWDVFVHTIQNTKINWDRSAVFFVFGTFISGPAYHYWFNYLNELPNIMWQLKQSNHRGKIVRAYTYLRSQGIEVNLNMSKLPQVMKLTKWQAKGSKILADQTIFAILYTGVFFVGIGMLNGCVEKYRAWHYLKVFKREESELMERYGLTEEGLQALKFRYKFHSQEDTQWEFRVRSSESALIDDDEEDDEDGPLDRSRIGSSAHSMPDADLHAQVEESIGNLLMIENECQTKSWEQIWNQSVSHMKEVYWQTYLTDCVVWPPLQLINFTFVPLKYQFLFVNAANLAWNAFLSLMANHKH
jgi:hypothetical protein